MKRLLPLFALLIAAAGCAAPLQAPVQGPAEPAVLVAHMFYSGLPDPTWNLTDEEWAELERRLSGLPDASASALPEQMLDYRGTFRIIIPASGDSAARKIYVAHGLVQIGEWGHGPVYHDVHGLEPWLKEQAATPSRSRLPLGPAVQPDAQPRPVPSPRLR